MNYIPSFSNYLPSFSSTSSSPAEDLQVAIQNGYISTIQSTDPALLSTPLSNGELPLNYAIRVSHLESVKTLLDVGCDPLLADDQGLNALSTAYFKEDYDIIAELLSRYLMKDVQIAKEIHNSGAAKKVAQIEALTLETKNWIPSIMNNAMIISFVDGNWTKQMKDLLFGSPVEDLSLLTKTGSSYLHTAILLKDNQMVINLLNHPNIDKVINLKNKNGLTPLHYAAALDNLDLMKKLIEKGAKYQIETDEEISPIALLATNLQKSSPFNVSKFEAAIFLCSAVLWTAQVLPAGIINGRLLQALQGSRYLASFVASLSFPSSLLLMAASSHFMTNRDFQNIFLAFNAFLTANLAYQTLQGLRTCWRNTGLSYQKSLKKAIVSYLPKATMAYNGLKGICEQFGYLQKALPTPLEELTNRDIKCLYTDSPQSMDMAKHCLGLSEEVYNHHDKEDSEAFAKSFDDFIERREHWKENFVDFNCYGIVDCEKKKSKVLSECDDGTNLHLKGCLDAEEIFNKGRVNGFEPNPKPPEKDFEEPEKDLFSRLKDFVGGLFNNFWKTNFFGNDEKKDDNDYYKEFFARFRKKDSNGFKNDFFGDFFKRKGFRFEYDNSGGFKFEYDKEFKNVGAEDQDSKRIDAAFTLFDRKMTKEEIDKLPFSKIRQAYHKLSKIYHPDKKNKIPEKMRNLNNAYELFKKEKR